MIELSSSLRLGFLLVAGTALAGCLGGGGGGGGGADVAGYQARFDTLNATLVTTDMPVTGTASYAGRTRMDLNEGGTRIGEVLGDVNLDVVFGPDRDGSISGTAGNFRGTIDGEDTVITGTLRTEGARAPSTLEVTEMTVDVPGGGTVTTRTGSLMVNLEGDLSADDDEAERVLLTLGGVFRGANAAAATGTASFVTDNMADPDAITGGGEFYVERQ